MESGRYLKVSTAFEQRLSGPIKPGLVAVGRFFCSEREDQKNAGETTPLSLAACTSGQRVIFHPNQPTLSSSPSFPQDNAGKTADDIVALSFGRTLNAIAAGSCGDLASTSPDILLLGSPQSVVAYDVASQRECFFFESEEEVCCLAHGGGIEMHDKPLIALLGGMSGITGLNALGQEAFWAVLGDNVVSLAVMPWGGSSSVAVGEPVPPLHIFAGCSNRNIEIVSPAGGVVSTIHETDVAVQLVPCWDRERPEMWSGMFGYVLRSGDVGVYRGLSRWWSMRGKEKALSITFCDVDGDGEEELLVGWEGGALEVRDMSCEAGTALFRIRLPCPIAAMLTADYRGAGAATPIVVMTDGTFQGLLLHDQNQSHREAEEARQHALLEARLQERRVLKSQVESLEEQLQAATTKLPPPSSSPHDATLLELASYQAELKVHLSPNAATHQLDIECSLAGAHPSQMILGALLHADPGFAVGETDLGDGGGKDTLAFRAQQTSSLLRCSVPYNQLLPTKVRACVFVGTKGAVHYHVFHSSFSIPRFIMLKHAEDAVARWGAGTLSHAGGRWWAEPKGTAAYASRSSVVLFFNGDIKFREMERHLRDLFDIPDEINLQGAPLSSDEALELEQWLLVPLLDLRTMEVVVVEVRQPAHSGGWRTLSLTGGSMKLVGDVLQALAERMPSGFCEATAGGNVVRAAHVKYNFEKERASLRELLDGIEASEQASHQLSVSMADGVNDVRGTLAQGEEARSLGEYGTMAALYTTVVSLNQELLATNFMRRKNFEQLKEELRQVHQYIQAGARLRLGAEAQESFTAECRAALKEKQIMALLDLICTGVQ